MNNKTSMTLNILQHKKNSQKCNKWNDLGFKFSKGYVFSRDTITNCGVTDCLNTNIPLKRETRHMQREIFKLVLCNIFYVRLKIKMHVHMKANTQSQVNKRICTKTYNPVGTRVTENATGALMDWTFVFASEHRNHRRLGRKWCCQMKWKRSSVGHRGPPCLEKRNAQRV